MSIYILYYFPPEYSQSSFVPTHLIFTPSHTTRFIWSNQNPRPLHCFLSWNHRSDAKRQSRDVCITFWLLPNKLSSADQLEKHPSYESQLCGSEARGTCLCSLWSVSWGQNQSVSQVGLLFYLETLEKPILPGIFWSLAEFSSVWLSSDMSDGGTKE